MNVLDPNQQIFFQKLKNLSKNLEQKEFYLIGGTALAFYLNHRKSIDFDFASPQSFQPNNLLEEINTVFQQVAITQHEPNTLSFSWQNVKISFFGGITQSLISPLTPYHHIKLASKQDISAMKIRTIFSRSTVKDYFDLAWLLEFDHFTINQLIQNFYQKYAEQGRQFSQELILKTLAYTEDTEDSVIEIIGQKEFWGNTNQQVLEKISQIINLHIKKFIDLNIE